MYHFKIITIGKLQEKYLQEGEAQYLKRIKRYAAVEFEELSVNSTKKLSEEETKILESAKLIEKAGKGFSVALTEYGKQYNSADFAKFIENTFTQKSSVISFLIAGAGGWDRELLKVPNQTLSLSPLTFPHHVARFVLIEQIYRAITIINNHPYNK